MVFSKTRPNMRGAWESGVKRNRNDQSGQKRGMLARQRAGVQECHRTGGEMKLGEKINKMKTQMCTL